MNCISMYVGHAFRRADRIALNEATDDMGRAGEGPAVHSDFLCEENLVDILVDNLQKVNQYSLRRARC
jgi:hypothetical protein